MRRLFSVLLLLLLVSCNNTKVDRSKQFYSTWGQLSVACNKIKVEHNSYTLTDCDSGVKEIINASNIITLYE